MPYNYTYDSPEWWKTIPDFPQYRISSWGRVINAESGRFLVLQAYNQDYPLRVSLRNPVTEEKRNFALHRLVGQAFMAGFTSYRSITFADGNKHNCHLANLRLGRSGSWGAIVPGSPTVTLRRFEVYPDLGDEPRELFASVREVADYLDVHRSNVYSLLYGERHTLRGMRVREVDVEGVFDGDRFVPWSAASLEEAE